jgi:hypothetical protein
MHYQILLKVWAKNAEEALDLAQCSLEETCGDGKNWDYVDEGTEVITEMDLSALGVNSFDELEKRFEGYTKSSFKDHVTRLKEILSLPVAKLIMTEKDALLNIHSENKSIKDYALSLLKSGKFNKWSPKSFNEVLDVVADMIVKDIVKEGLGMFSYHISCIKDCNSALKYPQDYNAHNAHDSSYAEIGEPCNRQKCGLKAFYVLGSRHS